MLFELVSEAARARAAPLLGLPQVAEARGAVEGVRLLLWAAAGW